MQEVMTQATGWNPASVRAWISRQRAAGLQIDALSPGRRDGARTEEGATIHGSTETDPSQCRCSRTPLAAACEPATTTRAADRCGMTSVPVDALMLWIAGWLKRGGSTLDKPTRFESVDGRF